MATPARALLAALVLGAAGTLAACDDPTRPDTAAPRVVIRSPSADTVVASAVTLTVVLTDDEGVASASVQVGDGPEQPLSITPGDSVEATTLVQLAPGDNRVVVYALDRAGNRGSAERRVGRDGTPPVVSISSPARDTLVTSRSITVRGIFSDDTGVLSASYRIGTGAEQPVAVTPGREVPFEIPLTLPEGGGTVQVTVRDRVGNTQSASVRIGMAAQFSAISVGEGSTCALDAAGAAFCWGFRYDAQVPAPVAGGQRFQALSNGGSHACGVTTDGAVYCWGRSRVATREPVEGRFRSVSAGFNYTCIVSEAGAAYCWGLNESGQLGIGTTTITDRPTPVAGGISFKAVSAGTNHTCGLDTAGAAYCWGSASGALGLGTASPPATLVPAPVVGGLTFESIDVGLRTSCGVTATNQAYCWSSNSGGRPEPVAGGLSFRSIGMGGLHVCGVTPGGDAYCWGANRNGEVGNGTRQDAQLPVRVVGGISFRTAEASNTSSLNAGHSCGLSTDGFAYCWGTNSGSQLGNPSVQLSAIPLPVVAPAP
ncbi:MAG: Ig-like domain-containing protein [Gemmatimonadota bacterium]